LIRARRQLIASGTGNPIEAGLPIAVGDTPFRVDPLALLQPLKSRIQGTVVDEQRPVGLLLDCTGDALAVLVTEGEDPQNEQIQRALQEGDSFTIVLGSHPTRVCVHLGRMSTRTIPAVKLSY